MSGQQVRWMRVEESEHVVASYWLRWYFIGGILQDYGVDSADHPQMMIELDQAVGEVIVDTILDVLNEHADDPTIAAALREARGESS
jgi:hypothetical protein